MDCWRTIKLMMEKSFDGKESGIKMVSLTYLKKRIKDVRLKDIFSFFPMGIAYLIQPLFRRKYAHTWVVCERELEARDNGFYFFKYMCENYPEQEIFYALKSVSPDYEKVCKVGRVINYGGLKHWILYFVCDKYISSQKSGKPNAAVCAFLELNGISKTKLVFLQHGVIVNDVEWLHSDRCTFSLFVTSTIPECEFIKRQFSYTDDVVKLTGLPRFDNLHGFRIVRNRILIMPTWRDWFRFTSKREDSTDSDFIYSEYLCVWKSFLNSLTLKRIQEEYGLEIIFYLHGEMQPYINCFKNVRQGITIAERRDYDIQELLMSSRLLITDYSSVFFDMVYMKKPVLFYQFDEEKYRKNHYKKGYFDYFNNPFGKCFKEENTVLRTLEDTVKNDFQVSKEYLAEHERIFKYYDSDNCKRVYREILKL